MFCSGTFTLPFWAALLKKKKQKNPAMASWCKERVQRTVLRCGLQAMRGGAGGRLIVMGGSASCSFCCYTLRSLHAQGDWAQRD